MPNIIFIESWCFFYNLFCQHKYGVSGLTSHSLQYQINAYSYQALSLKLHHLLIDTFNNT